MTKKSILLFSAIMTMCFLEGCKLTEESMIATATKPPVEAVADGPTQEAEGTPTQEAEGTGTAQEKEENTKKLSYFFREETEEETDADFVYFKSSLSYPVFEGKYADNMNSFIASVTEAFRASLPAAKENAKIDYEDSLSAEYIASVFPEKEAFIVSCFWETEQYITLFTQCISSTGGAHPNTFCRAYVVDITTGGQESLEQMLEPYGITTEELVEYAAEKIRAEHGEALYEYDNSGDLERDVERFVQTNQWYFNDKGLVLFANPYEIAAYAYGMIECEISYEELEQGLKK